MGRETKIAWCSASWNSWRGCAKVSPGCANCYAEAMAKRNPSVLGIWGDGGTRVIASEKSWREPLKWNEEAKRSGDRISVFCGSMMDVFEERAELDAPRHRLFELIRATPNLDWLLLTKRPQVMWEWCYRAARVEPNVWLGVTVEDQYAADHRIPLLAPLSNAKVRFLSVEPMLGPIQLGLLGTCAKSWGLGYTLVRDHINWVIVGCESGPHRRPMNTEWILSIIAQCNEAEVPLFIKQLPMEMTRCDNPKQGVCHHPEHWGIRVNRHFPKQE
jgi:protein gp37